MNYYEDQIISMLGDKDGGITGAADGASDLLVNFAFAV